MLVEQALNSNQTLIVWNYSNGIIATVTLKAIHVLTITNLPTSPCFGVLQVTQDATGGRTLQLPGGSSTPSGFALSTTAGKVDVIAFRWDGTYLYWSIDKDFSAPSPFLEDIIWMPPYPFDQLVNTNGIWTLRNPYNDTLAQSQKFLAANTDGYLQMQYDAYAYNSVMGFSTDSSTGYTNQNFVGFNFYGAALYSWDQGSPTLQGTAASGYYRIRRAGSNFALEHSTDGLIGWMSVYSYTHTSSEKLYVQLSLANEPMLTPPVTGKQYYPKGYNLTL